MAIAHPPPLVETPTEEVTTLKPSEAIILGRMTGLLPLMGRMYEEHEGRRYACTLGAMAAGYGEDLSRIQGLYMYWPDDFADAYTKRIEMVCQCGSNPAAMSLPPVTFVMHTYDAHVVGSVAPALTEQDISAQLAKYGL